MGQYKDVTWNDGSEVDTATLSQMATNERYLFDHMSNVRYSAFGINKNTGVKVATGIAVVGPANAKYLNVPIYFGNYFTPGCKPVVVASLSGQLFSWVAVRGLAAHSINIDHTGFVALIQTTSARLSSSSHIHWLAVGY